MNTLIHLWSKNNSLIFKLDTHNKLPEIIHWGMKIDTLDKDLISATMRAVPQARLDIDIPLTICPELGSGLFSAPALEGHRDQLDWAPIFLLEPNKTCISGNTSVIFEAIDIIAQLKIVIKYTLDNETNVLKTSITLTNTGQQNYQLNKLVSTLPFPNYVTELMCFNGRWCQEFQTLRRPFTHNGFIQENRRGRTSHENFPGLILGNKGFTEQKGNVWGIHLGWSGNHQIRADVKSDGRRFIQAGELLLPGEIVLSAAQSYTTPDLYASFSNQGLNGLSKSFHQYVRAHILKFPSTKPRPVHLNTWEGIYFNHDPNYIKQMATKAAELGIERFIIDDGWFVGRNDDKAALGDWYLDTNKYPDGLETVIKHVNQLGMEFGLWVEPEMINKKSQLFQKHPDWLLELPAYTQPSGRYQYVLNLQNKDCFNYLLERLDQLLTEYSITYLKWDMNREIVQAGHEGCAAVHGQTMAYYRLVDDLIYKHPTVEIESCSSGGGRIDFEVLKRTHRFWSSDCNDALERQTIQRGMSYFFPPEVMGSHIGPEESHTTRRRHHINMRGLTALAGHMGVELDPVKESNDQKQEFATYIKLHKQYRKLLHHGYSFRLDSSEQSRYTYGVYNQEEMLVSVCQLKMHEYALPEPLCLDYLNPMQHYQVEIVDMPKASFQLMKQLPYWIDKKIILSGEILMTIGLALPLIDPESALLIHIKAI
ncbi:alpha-galactosidase [Gammaproteobacteria bacterium]|nr:alpha-galactosidase [Gammaproteobacteria bacterium]